MPGAETSTEFAARQGRWVEAPPIAAPEGRGQVLKFRLESSGGSVSVQLIRRDPDGRSVAWVSVHSGSLQRKEVELDIAELFPAEELTSSRDDVLVLRFKGLEGSSTVGVYGLQLEDKEAVAAPRNPGALGPEGLRWPRGGDHRDDTVLVFGTFDVENYGDLLFPLIAERRLAEAGLSITAVSPTDVATPFEDAPRPISIDIVARRNPPGKGVLIGGGNIIHLRQTSLSDYQRDHLDRLAYPALWIGATALAAVYDLPIAWNAPGVPLVESSWPARELFSAAAAAADYASVRDEESRNALGAASSSVAIVPDTAVEISRVWPLSELEPLARDSLESRGFAPDTRYVAVHVKKRSVRGSLKAIARDLDALSIETGRLVALVAIGACHGDDIVAQRLGKLMRRPLAVIDRASSIRQIAAMIACADLHISSSLHGYITSFSYGLPGLLVAPPLNTKFQAFTRMAGRPQDLFFEWPAALSAARERLSDEPVRVDLLRGAISRQLDAHWGKVAAALSDPVPGRSRRADFLRSLTAVNLHQAGWTAALSGVVSPTEAR